MPAPTVPKDDVTGKKFGRLTAVRFLRWKVFKSGKRQQVWEFKCDCGQVTETLLPNVKSAHTKSCGCFGDENRANRVRLNTKHGDARKGQQEHLYIVWCGMKQRCEDRNYKHFGRWGGRGIKVLWPDYESFRCDMGPSYQEGLQIERKDNDGHYSKANCMWATAKEQAVNRRSNVLLKFNGDKKPLSVWSELYGLKRGTLSRRLAFGWSVQNALTTPVKRSRWSNDGLRLE